jgi:hypothetical protein
MKFCENCGMQLNDEDMFCANCGTKQEHIASNTDSTGGQQMQYTAPPASQPKKKLNMKILIPIVVLVIAAVASFVVYTQLKKRVNINEYITVEYSGYDSVGTAKYVIDKDGLSQALLKAQGKSDSQALLAGYGLDDSYSTLMEYVEISLDKREDLSNGDKVQVKISCNQIAESVLGIKLVYKDMEVTVEGLEATKNVDPFENVEVTFSGVSPKATAKVSNNSTDSYLKELSFKVSKTSGIKIGDTITVTMNVDEKTAAKEGYVFSQTSKTYKCEALDQYISNVGDLTEEQSNSLKKMGQDTLEAYFAQNNYSTANIKYEGAYTLISKSGSSSSNKVYEIFTVDVTVPKSYRSTETETETKTLYVPVQMSGVLLKTDGSFEYETTPSVTGSGVAVGVAYVKGYATGSEMYKAVITAQKDKYTYTVTGDIQSFGN